MRRVQLTLRGTQHCGSRHKVHSKGTVAPVLYLTPWVGLYGASGLPRWPANPDTKFAIVVFPVWAGPTKRIFMAA